MAWFAAACLLRWRAFFADLGLTPLELAFEDLVTDDRHEDAIRAVSELPYGHFSQGNDLEVYCFPGQREVLGLLVCATDVGHECLGRLDWRLRRSGLAACWTA